MSTLGAFAAASIALLLIPGPAVLYIIQRSISDGRQVGLAAVAGLEIGDLVQVFAATIGLSAVIAASATAFNLVKWAGVVYLVVTGLRALLTRPDDIDPTVGAMTVQRAFRQGIVVNALNPKTALFFLSIFPQFVDPSSPSPFTQSLVLGVEFVLLATLCNGTYSLLASSLRDVLLRGPALPFVRRYVSGTFFVGLGLLAATATRSDAS
jgi:threonine/homoserine/homoserine lactone efflux protein